MTTDTIEEESTQCTPVLKTSPKQPIEIQFPELGALKRQMLAFERGAVSAPNSRSCSFKNKPRPKGLRFQLEETRRNSLPVAADDLIRPDLLYSDISHETIQRVRSFKMTPKGIENRGDSFRRRSSSSIASAGSAKNIEHADECQIKRQRIPSDNSDGSTTGCSCASSSSSGYYRVLVTGEAGVGKSALTNQFMTSEYMVNLDITLGKF